MPANDNIGTIAQTIGLRSEIYSQAQTLKI